MGSLLDKTMKERAGRTRARMREVAGREEKREDVARREKRSWGKGDRTREKGSEE